MAATQRSTGPKQCPVCNEPYLFRYKSEQDRFCVSELYRHEQHSMVYFHEIDHRTPDEKYPYW